MLGLGVNKLWTSSGQKDEYAVLSQKAPLVAAFEDEYYRSNGSQTTFSDLITHSRTSNATMVDSDGLIKWGPHNLFIYSNNFDNAVWDSGLNTILTTDYAASPSGNTDASRLQFPASGATYFSQSSVFTAGLTYTYAIWAKATSADSQFSIYENTSGAAIQSPRKTATSEWQLFTFEFTASNTGTNSVGVNNEDDSYATDILIYGVHLYRSDLGGMVNNPDRGDSYVPTTSSAVYLPRRGHHVYNGYEWVNEGVLVESEARSNLIPYANFAQAWGSTNTTRTQDAAVSPDGNTNALQVEGDATVAAHNIKYGNLSVSASTAYTLSVYAKKGTHDAISLRMDFDGIGSKWGVFDLTNELAKTGGAGSAADSATIEDVGNGWFKCSITHTSGVGDTTVNPHIHLLQDYATSSIAYDATGDIVYFYGAQLEAASTPSSYIPTNGSTVTRAAETFTIPSANLPWPTPQYIGDELVTNGTFDTDTSGWTAASSASLSVVSNQLRVTNGATLAGYAYQAITTEVGKTYRFTADFINTNNGVVNIGTTVGGFNLFASGQLTTTQTVNATFTATTTTTYIYLGNWFSTSGYLNDFDNISVREINPLSVSIQQQGRITYADEDSDTTARFNLWLKNSNNYLEGGRLNTAFGNTGGIAFISKENGTVDLVSSSGTVYSPDILVPYNISSRHGSTFINGAYDGVALTANTTPTALPDLSSTDLSLAYKYMGTIKTFRIWDKDIGDTGIATATEPSIEASLSLTFDGQPSSYTNTGVTV